MSPQDVLKKLMMFGPLAAIVLLSACTRPECHNTNPVFDQHSPYSKVYKDELVAQLKTMDSSDVRYWIDTYEGLDGEVFIHLFVQGGDLCAKAVLTIPPEREKKLHAKKGNWKQGDGSRGAEVIGLKFDAVQNSETTELIFQGWDRMID